MPAKPGSHWGGRRAGAGAKPGHGYTGPARMVSLGCSEEYAAWVEDLARARGLSKPDLIRLALRFLAGSVIGLRPPPPS
jgi:hypothetical protein